MHSSWTPVILILQVAGFSPLARLHPEANQRACVNVLPRGQACWSEAAWRAHLRSADATEGAWVARMRMPAGRDAPRWDLIRPLHGLTPARPVGMKPRWLATSERWRLWISDQWRSHDGGGLLRALVLHESTESASLLRLIGFVHLLNATGLHLLGLFSWNARMARGLGSILRLSVTSSLRVCIAMNGLVTAVAWALSGGRFGLLRSLLLLTLRSTARRTGFRWRFWTPLAIWAITECGIAWSGRGEPGGWVYGLSVAGALASGWGAKRGPSHWHVSLASWVPAALWEGAHASWVAFATPLLNLVCLPLFGIVLYPACLASAVAHSETALHGLALLTSLLMKSLTLLALQSRGLWWIPRAPFVLGLTLAAILLAAGSLSRSRRVRQGMLIVGLVTCMGLRIGWSHARQAPFSRPSLLDVGQGDALLWTSQDRSLLVDTGPTRAKGEAQWLDTLAAHGVFALEAVLFTHLDEDHAGGLSRLASLLPIDCVGIPDTQWELPRTQKWLALTRMKTRIPILPASRCSPVPFASTRAKAGSHVANNAMGAYLLPLVPSGVFVTLGDADRLQERALVGTLRSQIRALGTPVLLKVSHHGSKTASDLSILQELQPVESWISCGAHNTYGHPHPWALDRLRRGAPATRIRRTDLEGDLEVD